MDRPQITLEELAEYLVNNDIDMSISLVSDIKDIVNYFLHTHGPYCHAGRDGECTWKFCPQNGRFREEHCRLDWHNEE